MKHHNSPSLFSFSLAYVAATVVFGIVLSIVLTQTVAAAENAAAQREHERMSPEQRQIQMDAKFSAIDTNSDDMISQEELAAADLPHPRRGKGRHFGRKHHGEKGGERDNSSASSEKRTQRHADKRSEMQGKLFESMDSDSDGTLSRDEFAEIHTARKSLMKQHMFRHMDKNKDGFLDGDEFSPGHRLRN